jgi:hypothetical protein
LAQSVKGSFADKNLKAGKLSVGQLETNKKKYNLLLSLLNQKIALRVWKEYLLIHDKFIAREGGIVSEAELTKLIEKQRLEEIKFFSKSRASISQKDIPLRREASQLLDSFHRLYKDIRERTLKLLVSIKIKTVNAFSKIREPIFKEESISNPAEIIADAKELEQFSIRQDDLSFSIQKSGPLEEIDEIDFLRHASPHLWKPMNITRSNLEHQQMEDDPNDFSADLSQYKGKSLSLNMNSNDSKDDSKINDRDSVSTIRLEENKPKSNPFSFEGSAKEPSSIEVSPQFFNQPSLEFKAKRINLIEEARLHSLLKHSKSKTDSEMNILMKNTDRSP